MLNLFQINLKIIYNIEAITLDQLCKKHNWNINNNWNMNICIYFFKVDIECDENNVILETKKIDIKIALC